MKNLEYTKHRDADQILIEWAAASTAIGFKVTAGELLQFEGLVKPETITFILLKNVYITQDIET